MVYCGKLSTACERCRKRRIKCDERQPHCSQCLRAQEPCSGYRNVRLLSFRDQNEEVIRKVHSRSASSGVTKKGAGKGEAQHRVSSATPPPALATFLSPATPPSTLSPASTPIEEEEEEDDDDAEGIQSATTSMNALSVVNTNPNTSQAQDFFIGEPSLWTGYDDLQRQLSPSASEVGRYFFWNNYVLEDIRSAQGWLGQLSPAEGSMYENPAVMMVIEAIGLASVANMQRVPALMAIARKQYAEAVSWTNVMLSSLNESISDSTLAAVILLGMFEIITGTGSNSVQSWRNHITGATKLIEMRGVKQLCSPLGLQMFTQLRTQIVINNIYWKTNTSPLIAELSACAENLRSADDTHIDRLANIIIRLGSFCTAAKASANQLSDPMSVILQGMAIDTNLVSWANSLPEGWAYTTEKPAEGSLYSRPGILLRGEYHTYPSMWMATAWNNYRSGRIIVNEVILDQLAELERQQQSNNGGSGSATAAAAGATIEENARLEGQSRKILAQMVQDICAGALYHIGSCLLDDDQTSNNNQQQNVAAGGYLLMWPAFLAAACSYTHTDAHHWLTQCLEKIGYRMGIHQALAMVALLRRGLDSRVWLRHIGSG